MRLDTHTRNAMRVVIGSVALFFAGFVQAATPIDGWYTSVFGGYTYLPNNIDAANSGFLRTDANYNSGYDVGGALGFKSNPMRYEAEITYLNATLSKFNLNGTPQTGVTGYNNGIFAMANVYYDFRARVEPLQPFLGAGIGYGWLNNHFNATGPSLTTRFHVTNSAFSYQGTAGIAYHFAENYSLSAAYRYLATDHISDLGASFQAHLASVSATYRFDGNNYK